MPPLRGLPASRVTTRALAIGDVDGDGDEDLVMGNLPNSQLYLNQGAGTFVDGSAGRLPAASGVTDVELADVDGDGDLDLVFGITRRSLLFLNDGTGVFQNATAGRLPSFMNTEAVAMGDIDGDGDLDMLAGTLQRDGLFENDGSGVFTNVSPRLPSTAMFTYGVVLADLDGDGDLDAFTGGTGPASLYVNDGGGTFVGATRRLPAGLRQTRAVAAGDVDGDGDSDVILAGRRELLSNLLRQVDVPARPRLGQSYTIDAYLRYGPASSLDIAVPFVATGTASTPLPPLGTLKLDPARMAALPPFVVPQPAGTASVSVTVPNAAALAGVSLHAQVVLWQQPFAPRLSNATADVIQP